MNSNIKKIFLHELDLMKSRGFIVGLSKVSITDKAVEEISSFYGVEQKDLINLFNNTFKQNNLK